MLMFIIYLVLQLTPRNVFFFLNVNFYACLLDFVSFCVFVVQLSFYAAVLLRSPLKKKRIPLRKVQKLCFNYHHPHTINYIKICTGCWGTKGLWDQPKQSGHIVFHSLLWQIYRFNPKLLRPSSTFRSTDVNYTFHYSIRNCHSAH